MLHHHILVLPVIDIEIDGVQCHLGIIGVGTQHAHADIVPVPVVLEEGILLALRHPFLRVLRDNDLIIAYFLHIVVTHPGKGQLQIRDILIGIGPGLRVHVCGIGHEIIPILVKQLPIRLVGLLFIKVHGIFLVSEVYGMGILVGCCLVGINRNSIQRNTFYTIHQINVHFLHRGPPVFVNRSFRSGFRICVLPAGIYLYHIVHLDSHRQFTGIPGDLHGTLGNYLGSAPALGRERQRIQSAHHEPALPVIELISFLLKIGLYHIRIKILQRKVFQCM